MRERRRVRERRGKRGGRRKGGGRGRGGGRGGRRGRGKGGGRGENKPDKQGNASKIFLVTDFQMHVEMKICLGNKVAHSSIFKQRSFLNQQLVTAVLFLISEAQECAYDPNCF